MRPALRHAHDEAACRLAREIREEGLFVQIADGRHDTKVRVARQCVPDGEHWPVTIRIGDRGSVRVIRQGAVDETFDVDRWRQRGRWLYQRARGGGMRRRVA